VHYRSPLFRIWRSGKWHSDGSSRNLYWGRKVVDSFTKAVQLAQQEKRRTTGSGRALVTTDITYTQTRTVGLYPGWLRQNRVLTAESTEEAVQAYKVLRTQVHQRMRANGWRTLGITSPKRGEGKTVTAINLAISLAMEPSHTVLLVDADLRQPSVHTYLGLEVENGLREYLLGAMPVEQILVHPMIRRMVILPGSGPVPSSSELLVSPVMLSLVQELKRRYPSRHVVFDLPPVLGGDDVLAFAPYLDAMLLVAQEGRTNRDELARAAELIQGSNQNLMGTVLNRSAEQTSI
jgi:protein-tyrosine kinase